MSILNILNQPSFLPTNSSSSLAGIMKIHKQFAFYKALRNAGVIANRMAETSESIAKYQTVFGRLLIEGKLLSPIQSVRYILQQNFYSTHYEFFGNLDDEQKIEIEPFVNDESKRIRQLIFDIYKNNGILTKMEPREFEEMIGELLRNEGFHVELTKQTRDNGFDILALKYLDKHLPLKFLVECKRFSNKPVGVEIIRSFKEVLSTEKANRGIIVTTSYFSSEAKKKQKEIPYLLDFRDKNAVIDWVNNYMSLGEIPVVPS